MNAMDDDDLLPTPTEEDRDRMRSVWQGLADGSNYVFSPANFMEIWMAEHRVRAERIASARLARATWVLSAATVVLALSTIALVIVSLQGHA